MAKKKTRKTHLRRKVVKRARHSRSRRNKITKAHKAKVKSTAEQVEPLQPAKDVLVGLTQHIDQRLDRVEKKLGKKLDTLEHEEEQELKVEKKIVQEERAIEKKEQDIEKVILQLGNFTLKKKYLYELIRGTAGAFLGVGIGANLMNASKLAEQLGWLNVFGILLFILAISALLIYKNERDYIREHGLIFVPRRLFELYLICIVIEVIGLALFGAFPSSFPLLLKAVIIGSYAAMSGAVSFTIAW